MRAHLPRLDRGDVALSLTAACLEATLLWRWVVRRGHLW